MFDALAMLRHGGLVMFPLALCSLAALTVVIERAVALRRRAVIDAEVVRLVDSFTEDTPVDQTVKYLRRSPGPFARIIEETLRARNLDHAQIIETMHATGRTQVGSLERGLTLLEIIANVSPLLGLLGTVLGMVTVFNAITAQGIGNPQVLSDGISKALITTVVGLTVAIPSSAFHSWFSRRVDDYAVEMEERATAFVARLFAIERQKGNH